MKDRCVKAYLDVEMDAGAAEGADVSRAPSYLTCAYAMSGWGSEHSKGPLPVEIFGKIAIVTGAALGIVPWHRC